MMNLNIQRFWRKRSVTITDYDPTYKVVYLGNVLTAWAKGEGCVDKPLATIWKNYCQSTKADVCMKLTACNSGLKAVTKEHGLTEYWANRITYCGTHPNYPKLFCWVYRHEGRRLKQELRCHAALCAKEEHAVAVANQLQQKVVQALQEFRREKLSRQKARLSLANCVYDNPSLPRRKILLSTGTANYRPPLERSKSAPKLMAIEESLMEEEEDIFDDNDIHRIEEEAEEGIGDCEVTPVRQRNRRKMSDDFIDEALEEDVEDEEDRLSTRLPVDQESLSSLVSVEIVNSKHDLNQLLYDEGPFLDGDEVVDLPGGRKSPLTSIEEDLDDGDNISDESGYSEEREAAVCKA